MTVKCIKHACHVHTCMREAREEGHALFNANANRSTCGRSPSLTHLHTTSTVSSKHDYRGVNTRARIGVDTQETRDGRVGR